jgi:hypothetical protein
VPQGILGELAESYGIEPVLYMGFLDGINSSLKEPLPLEKFDEQSEFTLDIDYDVLLFNMHVAAADYLYGLEEWDRVFFGRRTGSHLQPLPPLKDRHQRAEDRPERSLPVRQRKKVQEVLRKGCVVHARFKKS